MGIFFNPPPPPTANNAGTPPEPHVPIGTQGQQPPRYTTAFMLVAVLASWPLDLEPRLQRPNDQQKTKIAPLTLTYGQQPPRFSVASRMAVAVNAWPPDLEPRLGRPNDQQQKIAPLTLVYGQSPPRRSIAALMSETVGLWPADLEPRLTRPNDLQQTIAPLTFVYGQQPPRRPPLAIPTLTSIVATWAESWSAQVAPNSAAWNVPVVQLIPYQPLERQIVTAWDPPWIGPPDPVSIAPLTLTYGQDPPRYSIATRMALVASWPADLEPRLQRPNDQRQTIAPLTLAYGSTPIPSAFLTTTELAQIVSSWPLDVGPSIAWPNWTQRTSATVAAFVRVDQPPVVDSLSLASLQAIGSWPVDIGPLLPRPDWTQVQIAPLTLAYGAQPVPRARLDSQALAALVAAWTPAWDAQTAPDNASWNIPALAINPFVPLPKLIWTAWEPAAPQPPKPVAIAPLTLVYGNQPPPQAARQNLAIIGQAWTPDATILAVRPSVAWNVVLVGQVPRLSLPPLIWTAWVDAVPPLFRPIAIAPLTLRYGTQPTPQAGLSALELAQIVGSWPADVGPVLPRVLPPTLVVTQPTASTPPTTRAAFDKQIAAAMSWIPPFINRFILRPLSGWNALVIPVTPDVTVILRADVGTIEVRPDLASVKVQPSGAVEVRQDPDSVKVQPPFEVDPT